jgi:hypothetical protein
MPWDEIFATGGSRDYRAKGNSYSHKSYFINPTSKGTVVMADEPVGRNYHSGSLLLKDGRVLVFGGDPLYADKDNTMAGKFEQRLTVFTPPQFFRGDRPILEGADGQQSGRGEKLEFASPDAASLKYARLIPPSSATHVTNIEQRTVAAKLTVVGNKVSLELPKDPAVLPDGWYMLFVVGEDDRSSVAKMVRIVR